MKKYFLAVALPLVLLCGCKNQTIEEKTADYEAKMAAIVEEFNETMPTIEEEDAQEEFYMKCVDKIKDLSLAVIKKNSDNALGVKAFQEVYPMLEEAQASEILAGFNGETLEDPFIKMVTNTLEAKKKVVEGGMFLDFEVDGVKFSDYVGKGKYILVDFWASWCGPCKQEIPNIKAVYEKYAGDDFDVLSIAVWDKPEDTIKAAEEHGVVWNQIINAQKIPTDLYGIEGIPQIMLFGPDGTIVKKSVRGAEIEAAVAEALGR